VDFHQLLTLEHVSDPDRIESVLFAQIMNWPPFRPDTSACVWRLKDSLKHVHMSELEIITDGGRRRRWSASEKLRIVEETLHDSESISAVARRNGVAPNLLYRWRKLMLEGGSVAVAQDDSVTGNKIVREMEARIRELERQLGRKTMEVEILKEALDKTRLKKPTLRVQSLKRDDLP